MHAHRRGVRAGRRVRHHPQRIRLPPAHLQRTGRHPGRDHDPRVLVAAHPAGVRALRRHDQLRGDQRRRSPPPVALRRHHPPRDRHRGLRRRSRRPASTCCSSGGSTRTRARRTRSRSLGGRVDGSTSPGIVQDQPYFDTEVAPHLDGTNVRYLGPVAAEDRSAVLGAAHALLHLIDFDEPFGYSVVEAMACGTPVVAYARGSMGELVDARADGLPRGRRRGRGRRARVRRRARSSDDSSDRTRPLRPCGDGRQVRRRVPIAAGVVGLIRTSDPVAAAHAEDNDVAGSTVNPTLELEAGGPAGVTPGRAVSSAKRRLPPLVSRTKRDATTSRSNE